MVKPAQKVPFPRGDWCEHRFMNEGYHIAATPG